MRGDPPLLVQAAIPAEEDHARAVARAAEVRDGLLGVQHEVPVVDHVDAAKAVAQVLLALGPQDRLVHVPGQVEPDGADLIERSTEKGDISAAVLVIPTVQRNGKKNPKKMAHRVAVSEGVLQHFSGGFVDQRERR